MNLTYIIGNGFDLGLGLKTSYRDFLECYLCEEHISCDPPCVSRLKRMIRRSINSWADAEREFGRLDYLEFGDGTMLVSNVASAYEHFRANLNKYIRWRERQFPQTVSDMKCSRFRQALLSIHTAFLDAKARNEFWGDAYSIIHVNFLNFNYTDTLERLIGAVPDVLTREIGKKKVGVYFSKPLHVHGEVCHRDASRPMDVDIVFGVGDTSQLSGLSYEGHEIEFEQIRSFLEKKDKRAALTEGNVVAKALKVLSESDCIVLFGVSLGATDCFWWNAIFKTLLDRPAVKLVFSPFHNSVPDCDAKAFEENERQYVMGRFAEGAAGEVNPSVYEELCRHRERILIVGYGPHKDFADNVHFYDPLHLSWFKDHLTDDIVQ